MNRRIGQFSWRGHAIGDVEVWAAEHGDRMVDFLAERTVVCPVTLNWIHEAYEGSAPALFFDSVRLSDGWGFTTVHRRAPKVPE